VKILKKYNIIVLTDHKTHTEVDSFYSIINKMKNHVSCNKLVIASRSYSKNTHFFNNPLKQKLFAIEIKNQIKYEIFKEIYKESTELQLDEYDVIILRIDKPILPDFLIQLETVFKHKIFINSPKGILKTATKEYLTNFTHLTPKVEVCSNTNHILEISKNKEIVIKPLNEDGGKGIARVYKDKAYIGNLQVHLNELTQHISTLIKQDGKVLIMDFLKEVQQGDKRIIVVNGHILGAILRVPPSTNWLCNVKQGARTVKSTVSQDEINIINIINEPLQNEGIVIYGIDTLVDNNGKRVLSEINTSNVGGLIQLESFSNKSILNQAVKYIFEYIHTKSTKG